jgi:hypothetical protein
MSSHRHNLRSRAKSASSEEEKKSNRRNVRPRAEDHFDDDAKANDNQNNMNIENENEVVDDNEVDQDLENDEQNENNNADYDNSNDNSNSNSNSNSSAARNNNSNSRQNDMDLENSFYIPDDVHVNRSNFGDGSDSDGDFNAPKKLRFDQLLKIAEKMPQWNDKSISHSFLRTLKTSLRISGLPQVEWIRLLPLLFDKEKDLEKSEWVLNNIVDAGITSWNTACELFNKHFQQKDYRVDLEKEYQRCYQGGLSAQDYSDKFKLLCTQLNIQDNNQLAINNFIHGLKADLISEYYDYIKQNKNTLVLVDGRLTSLKQVMDIIIDLEVEGKTKRQAIQNARSSQLASNSNTPRYDNNIYRANNNNNFRKFKYDYKNKRFSNNSNAPTDDDRRKNYRLHNIRERDNKFGNRKDVHYRRRNNIRDYRIRNEADNREWNHRKGHPDAANNFKATVTCHACGEKGHYANDPKCPEKLRRNAEAAASTNNSSNNSNNNNNNNASANANSNNAKSTRKNIRVVRKGDKKQSANHNNNNNNNSSRAIKRGDRSSTSPSG